MFPSDDKDDGIELAIELVQKRGDRQEHNGLGARDSVIENQKMYNALQGEIINMKDKVCFYTINNIIPVDLFLTGTQTDNIQSKTDRAYV